MYFIKTLDWIYEYLYRGFFLVIMRYIFVFFFNNLGKQMRLKHSLGILRGVELTDDISFANSYMVLHNFVFKKLYVNVGYNVRIQVYVNSSKRKFIKLIF